MPIRECDPWRLQYFEHVACPEDVFIPTDDPDAWRWYPAQRWIYNKLLIAESQGIECAPHGVEPRAYPVFSKPIFNLRGMGAEGRLLRSAADYARMQRPGHMWMTLLEGEHVSSDVAVVGGCAVWFRHATGAPGGGGTFDYWTVEATPRDSLERYCADWIARYLREYTGMINLETIGGRIIEAHLRFADQWPDLYGREWLEAVVGLYSRGEWRLAREERRAGYSVVLFGPHGRRYRHPPRELVAELLDTPGVSSVQVTFHDDRPPEAHAMPPGGFRLAIVNCWSLSVGQEARARLAEQWLR